MKIGVLTLPFNNNYGGYLQAYALMTVLKQEGHDVELVYRQINKKSVPISYFVKNTIKILIGRKHGFFYPTPEKHLREKGKNIMSFVDKGISPRSKPLYSTLELAKYVSKQKYDVLIAGSDQLWRPEYVPNIEDFFFAFCNDNRVCKLSYAASFGTRNPNYTEEQKKVCGDAISRFNAVSVRESSAIDVISDFNWITKKTPVVVLDPTLLLSKEYYHSLISDKHSLSKGKVYCYVLDESDETKNLLHSICNILKKTSYTIYDAEKWNNSDYIMPSMEDWLCGIRDADFVVTDSFHGAVFCILFNKPFLVCVNKGRGEDRFDTLLGHFGLNSRAVNANTNLSDVLKSDIDWLQVNSILEEKRFSSLEFLKNEIFNCSTVG